MGFRDTMRSLFAVEPLNVPQRPQVRSRIQTREATEGSLEDFAPHAGTLSGIFCIPPTYNSIVDASSDLPGPGAVALAGTLQLSPGGAFIDALSLP